MTYHKRDLSKALVRSARVFTFDLPHLPTEASLEAFQEGLRHWPDFLGLERDSTQIRVVIADRENKLGRVPTDQEMTGRLVDLASKLLLQGGSED